MAGMTLRKLLQDQLGVDTHPVINPETDTADVTATLVANNNPNRVGLNIINLSANVIYVMFDNDVSATRGIRLDANGGALNLVWQYDMAMIGWEWWAIAIGAASAITVIETVTL